MPAHYYNENDPGAAAWLRELMKAGLIPAGTVDERSITDVRADDVAGFAQCHFFAGIGGWPLALRLAGWPVTRPVWTGSCPCQPFSAAGRRKGTADARHLWPELLRLVAECRPSVCFGEQVASKAGREWLARVRADVEALGYRLGAADLCAAGVAAPHIRQRLWWVADAERAGIRLPGRGADAGTPGGVQGEDGERQRVRADAGSVRGSESRGLADARHDMLARTRQGRGLETSERAQSGIDVEPGGVALGLADPSTDVGDGGQHEPEWGPERRIADRWTGAGDFWARFDLIPCRDGKARRVEPGLEPLAYGVPARVGRLRGYGNAIVPAVAAEFIQAYLGT